jgi:hypothetical protein
MHFSEQYILAKHGDKSPDIAGLKMGDWFLFCGHCGFQSKANTAVNNKCPDCRKPLMICTVEAKDLEKPLTPKPPPLSVTIEDGKYTVIQEADGHLHALRNGVTWRDLTGDNLILCLAQEVQRLREQLQDAHFDGDKAQ